MSNTGHSVKCHDLTTIWDKAQQTCIPCAKTPIKPGHEITPNCGFDDDGGRHEAPTKPCKTNTFNNGSSFHCTLCSLCPFQTERPCNTTADTVCGKVPVTQRIPTTDFPVTTLAYQGPNLTPTSPPSRSHNVSRAAWAVPLAILISIVLVALSAYVFGLKRKRGADILSAPLQTVLDNLDVLEELVILLDPESHVRKSTKHLASHCAFPSTWITYTYSMKDSKSPLKAVLEGVTCKNPDWTVGHLAKLLKQMERNDAIAALAKLKTNKTEV
uniref:TNFR-Cys domain-containing protein n=1 Tax=Astatotilapia calliptera TaxID=8154 RepID=A0AAX7TX86_ASTCA